MSLINQKEFILETTEDTTKLSQGIRKLADGSYEMIHHDRPAWILELNNSNGSDYISIRRAPATAGEPSFTELIKIDENGNLILYIGQLQEL